MIGDMDYWQYEASLVGRTIVATLLGGVIGWERDRTGHDAGLRTCATVALGACVFGLVSRATSGDPTRIAAQVVTGIGFLGAGLILRDRGRVRGLTTAATVWAIAAMGLAVAFELYVLAACCTAILFGLLRMQLVPGYEKLTATARECKSDGGQADAGKSKESSD